MEPVTRIYGLGAEPSPVDIRDFTFLPDKNLPVTIPHRGGERYKPEDIEDQHRVGICTAISLTMNARKALGIKFSADFQYLLQKKFFDKNWTEGSSAKSALHMAYTYGFLPESEWTHTTIEDRKLSYSKYIAKLRAIPNTEIDRLLKIAAQHKRLSGYASVPVNRDRLAEAVNESKTGLIVRFVVGREWYTAPIEPLRRAITPISGHLITYCNYDGMSYRVANSWGDDWADKGTAYGLLTTYPPTEAWIPYYSELPPVIEDQKKQLESLYGQILNLLQKMVALMNLTK